MLHSTVIHSMLQRTATNNIQDTNLHSLQRTVVIACCTVYKEQFKILRCTAFITVQNIMLHSLYNRSKYYVAQPL